jgi:hypothetical protein
MSGNAKRILTAAVAIGMVAGTCATADAYAWRHREYRAPQSRHAYVRRPPADYGAVVTGSNRYYGGAPNEDLVIRQPNGTYIGTDPDANIRAYMRHDNTGPNGQPGAGM